MRSPSAQGNAAARLVVLGAVGLVVACSSGDTVGDSATARPAASTASTKPCPTPADSILGLATVQFTKHITPKPHRYLIPVGTDSALPAAGYWGLQTTGATLNLFPRDTVQQKKVKDQLGAKGAYTMLLVNYHGQRTLSDGRVAVDFSGHYMGGDVDGKAVPRTPILFSCHAAGERFTVEGAAPVS